MTISTAGAARVAAGAALALGLAAPPAHAQGREDVRVQMRITVPDDVIREVQREIQQAMRIVTDERITRFIGVTIREALEQGFTQGRSGQVGSSRNFRAEQTARETKTLQIGANGSIELRNMSGDITVTAGSGREVVVEIIRRARGRTAEDAKLGLERVNAAIDQRGDRIVVEATYPSVRNAPYSVELDYVVTAPAGVLVRAHSLSGDVVVRNMKGDVGVEVTSGNITISGASRVSKAHTFSGDVTLTDIDTTDGLSAGTISGDVLLQRVKARRVEIDVTSGDITARELSSEAASLKSLSGTIEFTGPLARGGRYELQAHSGDIHFMPTGGAGYDLQVTTFNGEIRQGLGSELKSTSSRSNRSLRGTVGDGSAIVVVTTFSGDVVIGRKR